MGSPSRRCPSCAEQLVDNPPIDRTSINAWEDADFLCRGAGNRAAQADPLRLVDGDVHGISALDALREGYEVYPVVDAIGGTSEEAHRAALERVVQAGAQPVSWIPLGGELQRDWARTETAGAVVQLVRRARGGARMTAAAAEPRIHELLLENLFAVFGEGLTRGRVQE